MAYNEINISEAKDFRESRDSMVAEDCVFYLVHEVSVGSSSWVRHDSVLADSLKSMKEGIAAVQSSIKEKCQGKSRLVFIGNMMAKNKEMVEDAVSQDIYIEICGLRASNNGGFFCFGLVGDDRTILLSVEGKDALEAMLTAAKKVRESFTADFIPLEIGLCSSSVNYTAIEANFDRLGQLACATNSVVTH